MTTPLTPTQFMRLVHDDSHDARILIRNEAARARSEEARLLEEMKAKEERIKELENALRAVKPAERTDGCWCHHARDVQRTGHAAACTRARGLLAKVSS